MLAVRMVNRTHGMVVTECWGAVTRTLGKPWKDVGAHYANRRQSMIVRGRLGVSLFRCAPRLLAEAWEHDRRPLG